MKNKIQGQLLSALGLVLLAGCVQTGGSGLVPAAPVPTPTPMSGEFVRPMSEMPAKTPARASAKNHTELGELYLQRGNNGVALDEARAAVAADSSYAPAHLLLAMVYAAQDQFSPARPSFDEASRLAPGDPVIANAYGWFLCSQGQENQGLALLEQAARNPYYQAPTRAWTNAGLCLLRKKDDIGAEERFVRAVQADEKNVSAVLYLADIAYRTDRAMRAKFWIDKAQKQSARPNVDVLWLAIRIEKKLGNQDAVRALSSKLRSEFPGSDQYQLYVQGKFE